MIADHPEMPPMEFKRAQASLRKTASRCSNGQIQGLVEYLDKVRRARGNAVEPRSFGLASDRQDAPEFRPGR